MRKLKQLFCSHTYVFFPPEDYYVSVGDEYHNRKSKLYRGECVKCKHQIEIIKRWTLLEKESHTMTKPIPPKAGSSVKTHDLNVTIKFDK